MYDYNLALINFQIIIININLLVSLADQFLRRHLSIYLLSNYD